MYTLTKFINDNIKKPEFFGWNFWDENNEIIGGSDACSTKAMRADIKKAEKQSGRKVVTIEANAQDDNIMDTFTL